MDVSEIIPEVCVDRFTTQAIIPLSFCSLVSAHVRKHRTPLIESIVFVLRLLYLYLTMWSHHSFHKHCTVCLWKLWKHHLFNTAAKNIRSVSCYVLKSETRNTVKGIAWTSSIKGWLFMGLFFWKAQAKS